MHEDGAETRQRLAALTVQGDVASQLNREELYSALVEYGFDPETSFAMLQDGRADIQLRANQSAANGQTLAEIQATLLRYGLDEETASKMANIAINRGPAVKEYQEAHRRAINADLNQEWLLVGGLLLAVVAFFYFF